MKKLIETIRATWSAPDKVKHLFAGAVIAAWTAILWPAAAWILPLVFAAAAGALKELADRMGLGTPDRADFWATLAGGAVVWLAAVVKFLI